MTPKENFRDIAAKPAPGLMTEFWMFLMHNKKWWLLPILLVILMLGVLIFLSGSPLAPFVYTLF